MISFACTGCGKKLQVKDEFAGRKTECPKCGDALAVPTVRPNPQIAEHKPTLPVEQVAPAAPSPVELKDPPPVRTLQRKNAALVITLIVGGLLMLLGVLVGVMVASKHDKANEEAKPFIYTLF